MQAVHTHVEVMIDGSKESLDRDGMVERLRAFDHKIARNVIDIARQTAFGGAVLNAAASARGYGCWEHVRNDAGIQHHRADKMRRYANDFLDERGVFDEARWVRNRNQALANHNDGTYPCKIDEHGDPSISAIEIAAGIRQMPRPRPTHTEQDPRNLQAQTTKNEFSITTTPGGGILSIMRGAAQRSAMTAPTPPAPVARVAGAAGPQPILPWHLAESANAVAGLAARAQQRAIDGTIDHARALDIQQRLEALHRELQEVCA